MLQFITHRTSIHDEVSGASQVLAGGCKWIQLRMKGAAPDAVIEAAHRLSPLCAQAGATFILDDHVELVEKAGADGVHLGKLDMPITEARKILGPDKIIGATANTFEDIMRAFESGADYIGLGPFRFTTTKSNLSPIIGIEGYEKIMKNCRDAGMNLPLVAIGGITADDIPALMRTGVTGIAISGALLNAPDIAAETRRVLELMHPDSKSDRAE